MVDSAMLSAFYRRSPQVPAKVRMLLKYLNEQYGSEPPWERRLFRGRRSPPPHRLRTEMRFVQTWRKTAMITLYHHGSSVCAAKVRIVLAEKSLPWEGMYVDILRGDQFDPAYMKLNPKAVVPTLIHDGKVIIESSVICEYLDEAFPDPPLKPANPEHRAAMRLWTKAVDEFLHPACAELTFASCHRFIIGRLSPAKFAEFLESTPPISVTVALACAQEGNRAARHGGAARRPHLPPLRQLFAEDGSHADTETVACGRRLFARRHRDGALC